MEALTGEPYDKEVPPNTRILENGYYSPDNLERVMIVSLYIAP
jgi:hypothetical protein